MLNTLGPAKNESCAYAYAKRRARARVGSPFYYATSRALLVLPFRAPLSLLCAPRITRRGHCTHRWPPSWTSRKRFFSRLLMRPSPGFIAHGDAPLPAFIAGHGGDHAARAVELSVLHQPVQVHHCPHHSRRHLRRRGGGAGAAGAGAGRRSGSGGSRNKNETTRARRGGSGPSCRGRGGTCRRS